MNKSNKGLKTLPSLNLILLKRVSSQLPSPKRAMQVETITWKIFKYKNVIMENLLEIYETITWPDGQSIGQRIGLEFIVSISGSKSR